MEEALKAKSKKSKIILYPDAPRTSTPTIARAIARRPRRRRVEKLSPGSGERCACNAAVTRCAFARKPRETKIASGFRGKYGQGVILRESTALLFPTSP